MLAASQMAEKELKEEIEQVKSLVSSELMNAELEALKNQKKEEQPEEEDEQTE